VHHHHALRGTRAVGRPGRLSSAIIREYVRVQWEHWDSQKGGLVNTYTHVPHPHTVERLEHRDKPVTTVDVINQRASVKFNAWLAIKITSGVGTMWCAYAFAALALFGLAPALRPGGEGLVAWIAQTFLQLVLLSIIIVGQNIASAASDARSVNTFQDAEAILSEALEIQKHLAAQDHELIGALQTALALLPPHPGATPVTS
jgi:hypothetical protein